MVGFCPAVDPSHWDDVFASKRCHHIDSSIDFSRTTTNGCYMTVRPRFLPISICFSSVVSACLMVTVPLRIPSCWCGWLFTERIHPRYERRRFATDGESVWNRDVVGFTLSTIDSERMYDVFKTTHWADGYNNQSRCSFSATIIQWDASYNILDG